MYLNMLKGECYYYGRGTSVDYKKAVHYFKLGRDNDNMSCVCNLGICSLYGHGIVQDYHEAVRYFKASSLRLNRSRLLLGLCYYHGLGVKRDYKESFYYFFNASGRQLAEAQNMVALSYEYGRGTVSCLELAVDYYTKAKENGCESAAKNLERVLKKINIHK